MKIELGSDSWTAATDELARMEKELRRRGYDLNKLAREKIDAELESRAMDFSRCWRTSR